MVAMHRAAFVVLSLIVSLSISAQSKIVKDFQPACDSLSALIRQRNGVDGKLRLKSVMKRGGSLDFYFTESLSDYPWRADDVKWFRQTLKELCPEQYSGYRQGEIYSRNEKLSDLAVHAPGSSGSPVPSRFRTKDPRNQGIPVVEEVGADRYDKGLSGRNIALWASHGRYYEQSLGRWEWQRPCLFQTVEDLFSASFVLPYLVPMLENAGAYVMMPRERDVNPVEIIIDNDPDYSSSEEYKGHTGPSSRLHGTYTETGVWKNAGTGFADTREIYTGLDNPFTMGTARTAECISSPKGKNKSQAVWTADIPERGEYAVYVSYRSFPNSTTSARYTVCHLGGNTSFIVNQKTGGGTWIYLGTFEFAEGTEGKVILDNSCPEGRRFSNGSIICADAVKIGGGTGNIARSPFGEDTAETSGLPRYAEAARYWLQWAGMDPCIYSQNDQKDDYRDDLFSRGDWVGYISGSSRTNPGQKGLGIPVDLTFAFHSDAGVFPNDSIVGTLAIYSRMNERSSTLPNGEDRRTAREYSDIVQSQIVSDLKTDSLWARRQIWNRAYRESRTPPSPTMLLESLSHQNFADMRYGLDPEFKFTLCRAVYKGMLKYLSSRYGCQYTVQPLPVHSFAAIFKDDSHIELSWMETDDPAEETAGAKGYILYVRKDGGAFSKGTRLENTYTKDGRTCTEVPVEPGHIYSYRITAFNEGGESFPSEILSAGIPETGMGSKKVIVVNNFTRVSAPTWYDTPQYAGFDNRQDSGVSYIRDIAFTGEMYQYRRDMPWCDDDCPGFGASYTDYAGQVVSGNTFDYPYVHGTAIIDAGYPFCSASAEAFISEEELHTGFWAADIICGKQVTSLKGGKGGKEKYRVFPSGMQAAIKKFTSSGGNILVSGSHIGTDIWDMVYPLEQNPAFKNESVRFAEDILGYRWMTNYASRRNTARSVMKAQPDPARQLFVCPVPHIEFNGTYNGKVYRTDTPDGIEPASGNSYTIFRYPDTNISAGTAYHSPLGYKAVSLGFPIEGITDRCQLQEIIDSTFKFFSDDSTTE